MVKTLIYVVVLLICISCSGYRTLEGKAKSVYFTPDSLVFNELPSREAVLFYGDILDLRRSNTNSVFLKKGTTSEVIIHRPTVFTGLYFKFLAFPGDHFFIKVENGNFTVNVKGSDQKNRELQFFTTFEKMKWKRYPPGFAYVHNASLDTILNFEMEMKANIPNSRTRIKALFDSLGRVYGISKKFMKLVKQEAEPMLYSSVLGLYQRYKDTLLAYGLFKQKHEELLPLFNNIKKRSKLGDVSLLNNIALEVMKPRIFHVRNEDQFKACFDSIELIFNGIARDYLLSRLMFRAYTNSIEVPHSYEKRYKRYSIDHSYRKIVQNVKAQRNRYDKMAAAASSNLLLELDGKNVTSFEALLAQHKGKLVFVDFWATWCGPCLLNKPYLAKLIQEFPSDKIVVLHISVENDIQSWQKALIGQGFTRDHNYLLINTEKLSSTGGIDINTIPRYVIFNKEGKLINADAPRPSDPRLRTVLDQLISESK